MNLLFEKISLLDLLPQSKEMKIKKIQDAEKILMEIEKILDLYNDYKNKVLIKKFGEFDPLIGENSCQIRAYMLYNLFMDGSYNNLINLVIKMSYAVSSAQKKIKSLRIRLKETKMDFSENKFTDKSNIDLGCFLYANDLIFDFPEDIYISFLIYFLSRYTINNNEGIHTGIDYKKMNEELDFSKNLSRRLIHKYQVYISKISCQYVRGLAEEIKMKHPEYLSVFDVLIHRDDDGRYVIPCYFSMDILLKHMALNTALILIQTDTDDTKQDEILLFELNEKKSRLCNFDKIPSNIPCVVFKGISSISFTGNSKLKDRLLQLDLKQLLLGSTARHPQFPGKNLDHLKANPFSSRLFDNLDLNQINSLKLIEENYLNMRDWALIQGCCLEQSETFFATHIFCDNYLNCFEIGYTAATNNFLRDYSEQGHFIQR